MIQRTRKAHPDIRIRATRAWVSGRGEEAPHLNLSPADRVELARLAEVIEYRTAGSQILRQGQEAGFVYLLADGVAEANAMLNGGDRQIVAFYWPGDLFGMAENGVYVNSAVAVASCMVYRFPVRKLERFLLENPNVQHSFFLKAVHDLRSAQRRLIVMGRFDISRRLAAFLLDCSGHERYFDAAARVLTMPMTRYDVADYLGASSESITRAFAHLEGKGLLRRIAARTVELNVAELRALVDFP